MDQTKIMRFLAFARKEVGYETLTEKMENTVSSKKRILGPFVQGNLGYQDTYQGFASFSGKEIITHKGKLTWTRFYRGNILDKTLSKEEIETVYAFLKKALAHFPNSHPEHRGPETFEEGEFEYKNTCAGNFETFKGTEEIYFRGKKVYELTYHN